MLLPLERIKEDEKKEYQLCKKRKGIWEIESTYLIKVIGVCLDSTIRLDFLVSRGWNKKVSLLGKTISLWINIF